MLLRTETNFKDDKQQVAAVFNLMFATELRENGYKDGMDPKRITDTWSSRRMAGRSREWLIVDDPPKDPAERQYCQRLLEEIEQAVTAIGVADDRDREDVSVIITSANGTSARDSKRKRMVTKQPQAFSQSE